MCRGQEVGGTLSPVSPGELGSDWPTAAIGPRLVETGCTAGGPKFSLGWWYALGVHALGLPVPQARSSPPFAPRPSLSRSGWGSCRVFRIDERVRCARGAVQLSSWVCPWSSSGVMWPWSLRSIALFGIAQGDGAGDIDAKDWGVSGLGRRRRATMRVAFCLQVEVTS